MDTVSFTRMDEGTVEDYALLGKLEHEYVASLPDRLLGALEGLRNSLAGYKIDRLEHSLQSATRAEEEGADIEMIVAALIHDLGDDLAPENHSQMAAAIIRPMSARKSPGSSNITASFRCSITATPPA